MLDTRLYILSKTIRNTRNLNFMASMKIILLLTFLLLASCSGRAPAVSDIGVSDSRAQIKSSEIGQGSDRSYLGRHGRGSTARSTILAR